MIQFTDEYLGRHAPPPFEEARAYWKKIVPDFIGKIESCDWKVEGHLGDNIRFLFDDGSVFGFSRYAAVYFMAKLAALHRADYEQIVHPVLKNDNEDVKMLP